MDKLKWYIYTIGCYTSIKRTQVMIHATTYMNIMVQEIKSQVSKQLQLIAKKSHLLSTYYLLGLVVNNLLCNNDI